MTMNPECAPPFLIDQQDWMTTLLDTVPALVVILDVQGRIVGFNQACETVSGYTYAEMKERLLWQDLILPEEQQGVKAVFHQLLAEQSPNQSQNYWRTKTGEKRLIAWSNTVLTTTDTVQFVIGTGIDITEQQQSALVLQQRIEHEQLLSTIAARIRQSLDLHTILSTTVAEVRHLLQTDRVLIFRLQKTWNGMVLVESVDSNQWPSILGTQIHDPCFPQSYGKSPDQIHPSAIDNIYTANLTPCHRDLLIQFQVQANLVVPIVLDNCVWGLLMAHHCREPRHWKSLEIKLLSRLAIQLAIAIQQSQLYRQLQAELTEREQVEIVLQEAKHNLEQRVLERTAALHTANQQLRSELQIRQQAETALQRSQQRFAGILEIAEDAIISFNSAQIITLFNQGAENMFGYPRQAILGQSLEIILPPDFLQKHHHPLQSEGHSEGHLGGHSQQRSERWPIKARRRDGTYFTAEASISKLQLGTEQVFTAILRDITERVEAQVSLAQLTHQNKLILHSMGEGLCGLDLEAQITFVNPAAASLLGYVIEDLIGQSVALILTAQSQPLSADPPIPLIHSLTVGATHRFITEQFRRRDGSIFPVEYVSTPIREQGKIVGAVITFKDISDRQVVERMKDEFISVVSHELRTPLTSIHGSLRMLASGLLAAQPDKSQRLLNIAVDSTDRLVRLINDILDVERIESGQVSMTIRPYNLADLMIQAANTMQGMASQMQVTIAVTPLSILADVDGDRIVQTLTNLLSNAIKFSHAGDTVWLSAEPGSLFLPSCTLLDIPMLTETHPIGAKPSQVCIDVRDQGRGIPPDKIDTIFERFQQADSSDIRNHEGTGLGLAICHSIVQQHGGQIWVESKLGEGSTFSFTLPVQPSDSLSEMSETDS